MYRRHDADGDGDYCVRRKRLLFDYSMTVEVTVRTC